jgi:hypothetical protein
MARRHPGVLLGERPTAPPAAVATLAPYQMRHASRKRQVAHPHDRAVLDLNDSRPRLGAAAGARGQLDPEVEPAALLDHAPHLAGQDSGSGEGRNRTGDTTIFRRGRDLL